MVGVFAGTHDVEKLTQGQACWIPACIWGDVRRDHAPPKVSPAGQVSVRINLLRLPFVGISPIRPIRRGVAVVAAGRIHEIAAEADQCPVLARQVERYWRDLKAAFYLAFVISARG